MVKDIYHNHVREALEKDGWTITHDPLYIPIGSRRGFIDLGAEKLVIAAEKKNADRIDRIAVEVKSFVGKSDLNDFENALGKFWLYLIALEENDPERILFLAIPNGFYKRFFSDVFFMKMIKKINLKMFVFDEEKREIIEWIK
jgi:hypothetical protein